MQGVLKIIDFYLNQLLNSKPSPHLKIILQKLIQELKYYNYPNIELVDIISIRIMIDYIISNPTLINSHQDFVKRSVIMISDILGDELYVKIEPKLISLEDEFRKTIALSQKQINDKLTEEVKILMGESLEKNHQYTM